MNEKTSNLIKGLRHCLDVRDRVLGKNGHYRTSGLRNVPGMDAIDPYAVWNSMKGLHSTSMKALELIETASSRLFLSMLCCDTPSEGFADTVTERVVAEFDCKEAPARLLADKLVEHDRRFADVSRDLTTCSDEVDLFGVPADENFDKAVFVALRSTVHVKEGPLPSYKGDRKVILEYVYDSLDDGVAPLDNLFKALQKIDPSISNRGDYTSKGVLNHANRISHRLWYDTGICMPQIEDSVRRAIVRTARTMVLSNMYAGILSTHIDTTIGLWKSLESKMVDVSLFLSSAIYSCNAVKTVYSNIEKTGGDAGLMLQMFGYDEAPLHEQTRTLPDFIDYLENGLMEVNENCQVVRNPANKYGGTLGHTKTASGATVATPGKDPAKWDPKPITVRTTGTDTPIGDKVDATGHVRVDEGVVTPPVSNGLPLGDAVEQQLEEG